MKPRREFLSATWRAILFLQAALVAWIAFTHGSGIELYLFKFANLSYKTVWSIDRNTGTVIAVLGLILLWRPYVGILFALSALYLVETALRQRYGGSVELPYPLVGNTVHFLLPLASLGSLGQRSALRLGQLSLFATLAFYACFFLGAPAYYMDTIISAARTMGMNGEERWAQTVLIVVALALIISFIGSKHRWSIFLLGLFSLFLAFDFGMKYGITLIPESLLKLELLPSAWLLYLAEQPRSSARGLPLPARGRLS